jgi:acyl dehydratase
MAKQISYNDINVGDGVTPLVKKPTTKQLVVWAGAVGDYTPIHYDKDFALSRGLSGVIVQGQLVGAFLGQMLTDWIGEKGTLKKLNCSYKGMSYPGETLTCRGEVTKKYDKDGEHFIECKIWAENPKGEKTASGRAVVTLPAGADN